ncbi:MAG: hypothetical protein HQL24_04885, partial [Candidatus Omnitrophica bacterium]|nr:hypothetical protein [Candidatus Omnitrophota bacterium]
MKNASPKTQKSLCIRIVSAVILFTFTFTSIIPPSYAQSVILPTPGAMVTPSMAYVPTLLKG